MYKKVVQKEVDNKMNTQYILSSNIRKLIKEKGFKQKSIAEQCKIEEKAFSNMLCNRQEIRTESLMLIAESLGVEVGELFKSD